MTAIIDHPHAKELKEISCILDENPNIVELAYQDIADEKKKSKKGAKGMNAEQVVRAAIIKQTNEFSYEELDFHLIDSACYRWFCRIGVADKGFRSSVLCANIKKISPATWEKINRAAIDYAKGLGIEKGRKSRIDCTVVESNIHEPTD